MMSVTLPDQLRDLVQRYQSAFNTNDAAAMNALFADDVSFVNFGGRLVEGRQNLLRAQRFVFERGGALEKVSVTYEIERVTLLSDTVVVVHARQRSKDRDTQDDPMEAIFTLVLQRGDEGWRIKVGQNTRCIAKQRLRRAQSHPAAGPGVLTVFDDACPPVRTTVLMPSGNRSGSCGETHTSVATSSKGTCSNGGVRQRQ